MPAVWRSFGKTLATGVLATTLFAAGPALGEGFDPEAFQMILTTSSNSLGPITYNPAFSGVTDGAMPFDILGADHPYANFFGQGVSWDQTPAYEQTGDTTWHFNGFKTGLGDDLNTGFNVLWSVDIDTDPAVTVSLLMNNPTPVAQTFTLVVPLVTGPIGPTTLMRGSASGTATDVNGNGGSISAVAVPGYQAWIDAPGNVVQTLIPAGTSVAIGNNATAAIGPYGFGQFPAPPIPGPGVVNQIGLTLTFTLSAFDSAIVNGVFEVVPIPGPGALPMLAVAGLAGVRRRRRA
jgi:hypothetical protein